MGRVLSALACERVGPALLTGGSNPNTDYLVYNIYNKLNNGTATFSRWYIKVF